MKKNILKYGFIAITFMGVYAMYACNQNNTVVNSDSASTIATENTGGQANVAENTTSAEGKDGPISTAQFDKTIGGSKLVMVDFYTTWCGPCKRMDPYIKQLKREKSDTVTVLQIDAEAQPEISGRYNLEGYPTVICFKNGKVVANIIGYQEYAGLLKVMRQFK